MGTKFHNQRKESYKINIWTQNLKANSPSFLPNAFLQPSHLQLMEHPTPPFKIQTTVSELAYNDNRNTRIDHRQKT